MIANSVEAGQHLLAVRQAKDTRIFCFCHRNSSFFLSHQSVFAEKVSLIAVSVQTFLWLIIFINLLINFITSPALRIFRIIFGFVNHSNKQKKENSETKYLIVEFNFINLKLQKKGRNILSKLNWICVVVLIVLQSTYEKMSDRVPAKGNILGSKYYFEWWMKNMANIRFYLSHNMFTTQTQFPL